MGQSSSRDLSSSSNPSGAPQQPHRSRLVQRLQTHLRRRRPEAPAATMFVPQRRRRSATDSVRSERRKRRVEDDSSDMAETQAAVGAAASVASAPASHTEIPQVAASTVGEASIDASETQPLLENILEEPEPASTRNSGVPSGGIPGMDIPGISSERQPRNQSVMLSRLLFLASAMTASSLVGTEFGFQNGGGAGSSSDDFDRFLAGLSRGLLSPEITAREPSGSEGVRPLNYFRMFRFPPAGGSTFVPVLVVGIRSSEDNGQGPNAEITTDAMPFFEAATSRPIRLSEPTDTVEYNPLRSRYERGRSILDQFMSDFGPSFNSERQSATDSLTEVPDSASTYHTPLSSTDQVDSTTSESASAPTSTPIPEFLVPATSPTSQTPPPLPSLPSLPPPTEATINEPRNTRESLRDAIPERPLRQSWIVYVFGGTYPEDHPIPSAGSLFTDEPTMEDLSLLERHLSPMKNHLATQEDVEQAGGLTTVEEFIEGEKCPICMTEYEKGDVCRKLNKCHHEFHKDCVDHWLLTGCNSCPMCRGEGVARA
ncbi:putative RING finger protein [Yarrowia sp. C11]|nr:putative RING finger protein [Yarrowia sp. C11]KAG5371095.1 putative RING finger protein [Yarrowia sp. E02]